MPRPLVLIHGYSAEGLDFSTLRKELEDRGVSATNINICNYISLNNEITIKDIAEGLERAFTYQAGLNKGEEFDAIVHSTGMLVLRSWLTNYGNSRNDRLKRVKHIVGLAPATWGSPQAHKGRTWLGALVKGNKQVGPDFLNAGDRVLEGLELGSPFTWDLTHADLLGPTPFYDKGADTPYVSIFIGNEPYEGLSSVANDPGTDGTVRWSGCSLNTRKITIDLTKTPSGPGRASISPWAESRLDVPMIAVDKRNHATLVSNPDQGMLDLIGDFLNVSDDAAYDTWLARAKQFGEGNLGPMLVDPGRAASGLEADFKKFFGHLTGGNEAGHLEGWQQFIVHARDEHGDPISDYLIEILMNTDGKWVPFEQMYTDVHAYGPDSSYRCFHIRLPKGILTSKMELMARVNASTGTELMTYQGYGDDDEGGQELKADSEPVSIRIDDLGPGNGTLFHPFTTTLIEIILNREPLPLNKVSRILTFLPQQ
jgi:hypothetical protein